MSEFGYLRDNLGNKSAKRLIASWGLIIGYVIAMIVILYGLNNVIASPDVVKDVTIAIAGAPFLTLISTMFEKRSKNKNDS